MWSDSDNSTVPLSDDESNDSSSEGRGIDLSLRPVKPIKRIKTRNLIEHVYDPPHVTGCNTPEATLQDIYTPLSSDTIRLVHLKERHPDSCIPECSLSEFRIHDSLGSSKSFAAVSYTRLAEEYSWYRIDLPELTTMVIQDRLISVPSRIALILGTLFAAGVREVWIDYLCINQLDDVERGQQVAIMNKIFQAAAQTVVFLGKPTADTDLLFAHSLDGYNYEFMRRREPDAAVDQIGRHRYWQRAWILQEIAF